MANTDDVLVPVPKDVFDFLASMAGALDEDPFVFCGKFLRSASMGFNQTKSEWLDHARREELGRCVFIVSNPEAGENDPAGSVKLVAVENITYREASIRCFRSRSFGYKWVPNAVLEAAKREGHSCGG